MPRSRIAALEFTLRWQSFSADHVERVYFERLSFWPLYAAWDTAA